MKYISLILLNLIVTIYGSAQSVIYDIEAAEPIVSNDILIVDQSAYFTFSSRSSVLYTLYLVKWDLENEQLLWQKKLHIENNSIYPLKVVARKDGTIIVGAVDYSNSSGFMNGNSTFIHFDSDGKVLHSARLGSINGGILRDFIIDQNDEIVFIGDRIGSNYAYRTIVGRLNKQFEVVKLKSIDKRFYTYGEKLAQDHNGDIIIGGSSSEIGGTRHAFLAKMNSELELIKSIEIKDPSVNTVFNHLYVDRNNDLHVFGNMSTTAFYLKYDDSLTMIRDHEFNYGYVKNAWEDENGKLMIFIEGSNYFLSFDKEQLTFEARYGEIVGSVTSQVYNQMDKRIYSMCYSYDGTVFSNTIKLITHPMIQDHTCVLYPQGNDWNGAFRIDSIGLIEMIVSNETAGLVQPNDIILSEYGVSSRLVCKVNHTSPTNDFAMNSIKCFPNPASDRIKIGFTDLSRISKLVITDVYGVIRHVENDVVSDTSVSLAHLPSGFYFVSAAEKGGKYHNAKIQIVR